MNRARDPELSTGLPSPLQQQTNNSPERVPKHNEFRTIDLLLCLFFQVQYVINLRDSSPQGQLRARTRWSCKQSSVRAR